MRKFRDICYDIIITEDALREEFEQSDLVEIESFEDFIRNCTDKNGFLEEVIPHSNNCVDYDDLLMEQQEQM